MRKLYSSGDLLYIYITVYYWKDRFSYRVLITKEILSLNLLPFLELAYHHYATKQ